MTVVSSPVDRQKILTVMKQIRDAQVRIDSETEFQKDALKKITEELFGKDKQAAKFLKRMAKEFTAGKHDLVVAENEEYEVFWENVMLASKSQDDEEEEEPEFDGFFENDFAEESEED